MASLQSKSTFFKHHLTGEAWPACRAIVPQQTPLDRRGMLGMVSVYRVRTSTIAKNRHLNIVLRAELHLRTGTYDRPNLAKALAIDAYPRIALFRQTIWYTLQVGERFLNPLRMKHHLRSGKNLISGQTHTQPEKKDPLRGSFFSYRPLAGAAPRSVPTQQKCMLLHMHPKRMRSNC